MRKRVLLVDDEYPVLFTLKALLEGHGYEVQACVYAREALTAIEEKQFDIAIVDYMLPDIRGDEVALKIKKTHPALPIVFLSGFFLPEGIRKLARATVTKPEAPRNLLRIVEEIVGTETEPASNRSPEFDSSRITRILVADDHYVVRKGIRSLFSGRNNFLICGEAENGQDAVEKARELHPDLILLDITMPVLGGLDAAEIIKASEPDVLIIVLSMHNEEHLVRAAKNIGLQGYVCKADGGDKLLRAIEAVTRHQSFFPA